MKRSTIASLIPAALAAFLLGAPVLPVAASPVTVTTTNNNVIAGSNPNTPQTADEMRVRSNGEIGLSFKAYIKFDLSGHNVDLLDADSPATIVLYRHPTALGASTANQRVYALNAGVSGYDWNSGAITWNNAPANVASGTGVGYAFTADATMLSFARPSDPTTFVQSFSYHPTNPGEGGEFYTLYIKDWKDYLQPDDTITIMLGTTWTGASGPSAFFTRNVATFSVEAIPEPAGGLLALGGLVLLPALRRRRAVYAKRQ